MYMIVDHADLWWPALTHIQPSICLSDRFDIHAIIDEEDYVFARRHRWSYKYAAGIKCSFDKLYAYRQMRVSGKKVTLWLHREIAWRAYGPPPTPLHTMSDHINGDSLDCRRSNLRWATPSMNAKNRFGIMASELAS